MKRDRIEFMIGWLDALRRDDLDTFRAMLDPHIFWQGLREDLVCNGPGEVVEVFVAQRDSNQDIDVLELIGGERRAILHARGAGLREFEGIALPDGIYNVLAIEGGKIWRIDDFASRYRALSTAAS